MNIRSILPILTLTASLAMSVGTSAQEATKAAPTPATQPTPAPEAANRPLTPQEREAILKKELEKLQVEKAFIERVEKMGGLSVRVRDTIMDRAVHPQVTDDVGFKPPAAGTQANADGTVSEVQPVPMVRKNARLLGDAEKQRLGADVVMTVDGLAVTKAEVEDVASYFKGYTGEASDDALKTRAMSELIKERIVEAAFPETTAKALKKIEEVKQALAKGQSFEDVAKGMSDCPSKAQGGDLGPFPREGRMDLLFAKAAFSQKVGDVSPIARTAFGYHIIKTTSFKKGSVPNQDEVRASHILALHSPDQMQVRQAAMSAGNGQHDVAFATDEWRKLCPAEFK